MKRDRGTERSTEKAEDRGKTGEGARPTGVFKRIADAEKASGLKRIVRHTQPENLKS